MEGAERVREIYARVVVVCTHEKYDCLQLVPSTRRALRSKREDPCAVPKVMALQLSGRPEALSLPVDPDRGSPTEATEDAPLCFLLPLKFMYVLLLFVYMFLLSVVVLEREG